MGFFSSIRKLFGGATAPTPGGAAEQEAALHQTPADSAQSPDSDPALPDISGVSGLSGLSSEAAEPAQPVDSDHPTFSGEPQASAQQAEARTTASVPSSEDEALTLALHVGKFASQTYDCRETPHARGCCCVHRTDVLAVRYIVILDL